MGLIHWFLNLTPHELDVIRTFGGLLAAISSALAAVATIYARLAYKTAKATKENTSRQQWVEGQLHEVSVAEIANRIHGDTARLGEEFRSEITDLVNDPRTGPQPRLHGRRRNPHAETDEIVFSPRNRPSADESTYT